MAFPDYDYDEVKREAFYKFKESKSSMSTASFVKFNNPEPHTNRRTLAGSEYVFDVLSKITKYPVAFEPIFEDKKRTDNDTFDYLMYFNGFTNEKDSKIAPKPVNFMPGDIVGPSDKAPIHISRKRGSFCNPIQSGIVIKVSSSGIAWVIWGEAKHPLKIHFSYLKHLCMKDEIYKRIKAVFDSELPKLSFEDQICLLDDLAELSDATSEKLAALEIEKNRK